MGYSPEVIPPNYLDEPPSDIALAQQNLDLLMAMMKGPNDVESHTLWNCLEDFLEKTTQDVYVMLDHLLHSIEFVLSTSFDTSGLDSPCMLFHWMIHF